MEVLENKERDRGEIFSRAVRAGKRTYFFDVKATVGEEQYLTITESKRRFNNEQGKFFYEKHKLFLYKEDFEKFQKGLSDVFEFIRTGNAPALTEDEMDVTQDIDNLKMAPKNIEFEDLSSETDK
ncbi:MAG: DUF3276 family protein [Bacteroidales bacterium]|jgi:hypothetical protein|nr:PUR family DNA/RNA-binding protein [Bacteroidales bacterium]MDD4603089.1 DUF3276 family protein [Bacteroidales bacterium]